MAYLQKEKRTTNNYIIIVLFRVEIVHKIINGKSKYLLYYAALLKINSTKNVNIKGYIKLRNKKKETCIANKII